ncbi:MAG: hypothetical protein MJA29_04255, partial [Candidatus Omnitrophica bacterium]|nr:hypothetical protein [Candidatus Omnitrophota bacterium]
DHIYNSKTMPSFNKDTFIKLMELATSGLFLYNDKLYRQVDGVTMGSPLGPTIANFCLAYFENKLMSNSDVSTKPSLYLRYVDDIFCVFRNDVPFQAFLDKLNSLHGNLRFTFELGPDTLPFLDTLVSLPNVDEGHASTEVYRKPTFTGLLLNANAICPQKWKLGLMQCLLHRAYTICSSWSLFAKEVTFLEKLFSQNGYANHVFQSCVNRFVSSKFEEKACPPPREDSVQTLFFIPYIGLPSVTYGKKVRQIFKRYFSIDVRIVFTTCKVKDYFSLKCRTPFNLKAKVIYKFTCLRDADISYIGKTKRHLALRMKEHRDTSASAVGQHLQTCQACQTGFNSGFSVIDTCRSDYECVIKEAIHIRTSEPKLNKQLFASGSFFTLNVF